MSLTSGTKLGTYEILSQLGAGGMGEVYLATDSKLDRKVAIKVLPEVMTRDPERVARFEREAKVLASLNHPSIAAIHGFDESNGTRFLVMEYVEGETLGGQLKNGALAVEDALHVGKQMAEALEAAHEKGVIHRDLKPANVMVRPDGTVKVLDFGLAKAFVSDHADTGTAFANSPTITARHSPTLPGVILGTAAYMSPEQARGKPLDKRTDIWSFGCVLLECLTGRLIFGGETVSDSIGAILHKEPDWTSLPGDTPPTVHLLLRRCLAKNVSKRLRDIGDARIELENAIADPTSSSLGLASAAIHEADYQKRRQQRPIAVALIAAVLVTAGVAAGWLFKPAATSLGPIVTEIPAPPDSRIIYAGDTAGPVVVSPNGRTIAFVAQQRGKRQQIWLRNLAESAAKPLRGTARAEFPFWSPDSQSIGFFASGKLMRVDLATQTSQVLCDSAGGRGGTWLTGDTIVYSAEFQTGLSQISSSGGVPRPVTEVDTSLHTSHRWPARVGDGNHFLFTAINHDPAKAKDDGIYLGALDGSQPKRVARSILNAEYACGKMLFVRDTVLMSVPIDLRTGEMSGRSRPIANNVLSDLSTWRAAFSASSSGVLAYHRLEQATDDAGTVDNLALGAGAEANVTTQYDRTGRPIAYIAEGLAQAYGRLSPVDERIAISIQSDREFGNDLWIFSNSDAPPQRVTAMPFVETCPVWSPDGTELAFGHIFVGDGNDRIYRKTIGGGMAQALVETTLGEQIWPTDWSPDGKHLLYVTGSSITGHNTDIHVLPLDGGDGDGGAPFPYLATSDNEAGARLSPNGKWLAYHACTTVDCEVYVVPFMPDRPPTLQADGITAPPTRKWQISVGGGTYPCWPADGKELYYISTDGDLVAVSVDTVGDTFTVGASTRLFQTTFELSGVFDVAGDGQSFFNGEVSVNVDSPITLIVNWNQDPKK